MAKTNRENLKDRFKTGRMPSETDFSDLIDSMVNALEEGFDKTPADGLKVTQLMGSGRLVSFYENLSVENPQWFLELGAQDHTHTSLHISTPETEVNRSVLALRSRRGKGKKQDSRSAVGVGINKSDPECELDVDGTIAYAGRRGKAGSYAVPADGAWHDITGTLTGCQAFEIMAGVGGEDSEGRYALTHAFAMNAFRGHGCIDYRQAYFGSRCERIELRWTAAEGRFSYKLQMRVKCAYAGKVWIKYQLTQLWFDSQMEASLVEPGR